MDTSDLGPHLPNRKTSSPLQRLRTTSLRTKRDASWRSGGAHSVTSQDPNGPEILSPIPRRHFLEPHAIRDSWTPAASEAASSPPSSPTTRIGTHRSLRSMAEELDGKIPGQSVSPSSTASQSSLRGSSGKLRLVHDDSSMARRWTRWMSDRGISSWVVPASIVLATWVKYCIGLGSYSGQGKPPMFGDYEAQRHWMEITQYLPTSKWYYYDLQYWGLDYPPLTAYHSWLCGIIGSWINPQWFALDDSRGIESVESKLFMRSSVLVSDILIYVPAIYMFTRSWQATRSKRTQTTSLLILLLQPALLLIDFGHFQYNSVMLGLTLVSLNCFALGYDIFGALAFVASLGFKQMALYYAPAIGSYLLAKCIWLGAVQGQLHLVRLGMVTVLAFILVFLPFLPPFGSVDGMKQPVVRIFPFARGLFEDKVANFWCASNVVFKWKNRFSTPVLIKISTAMTAVGFLPAAVSLLNAGWRLPPFSGLTRAGKAAPSYTPILPLLPYAALSSSFSFFLFSFQVHEKTILLPLLPISLLLAGSSSESSVFAWGVLVNNVACFSMWPLLQKDGLGIQYIALLVLWNRLLGYDLFKLQIGSFVGLLSLLVYTAIFVVHIAEIFVSPPSRYPDLYPVLNVLISMPVFGFAWIWSNKCLLEVSWAIGALGNSQPKKETSEPKDVREISPPPSVVRAAGQRTRSLGYGHVPTVRKRGAIPEMGDRKLS